MTKKWKVNLILLLTAAIWGFGFVAQRFGAMIIPPFTFNGFRFTLGFLSLIPLLLYKKKTATWGSRKDLLMGGCLAGLSIFLAAFFQQAGLETTEPGKAAFLTSCYIVLVPILGIVLKNKVSITSWIAVMLTIVGIYFLSIKGDFSIERGDLFQLIGAVFWALQILIVDRFVDKVDSIALSFVQFVVCAILCFSFAFTTESLQFEAIQKGIIPILYGGLMSVGVAYTLQTVAQKHAIPSHAALILGSESLFGTIGGVLFFQENIGARGAFGSVFILIGMVLSILTSSVKQVE